MCAFVGCIVILLCALFNLKPFYRSASSSGSWGIGLTDFEKGIPVRVVFNHNLSDTSFYAETSDNRDGSYETGDPFITYQGKSFFDSLISPRAIYRDTITTTYLAHNIFDNAFSINGGSIQKGIINIQTQDVWFRLRLLFPLFITVLVSAYCMWQIAFLLQSITKEAAFESINFKRLRSVGWAIIVYQLVLFFVTSYHYMSFQISFASSIPHYRSPITLSADTDSDFSVSWLLMGTAILILALAFKRGAELQQEQALTI